MVISVRLVVLCVLACTVAADVRAQLPDVDIWLSDVSTAGGELRLGEPVNVTRRPGYDNQPAFVRSWHGTSTCYRAPDPPALLFTSADSTGATDIFRWDPKTHRVAAVTHTTESEYSPTPVWGWRDEPGFYCVRVEADSSQRLWRFNIDGSNPRLVMSDVDSVGYFAWIDDDHLAAFILGNEKRKEPHTLRLVEVSTQTETIVARNIGRAIHRMPNGKDISFTVQDDDETFRFMTLHEGDKTPRTLIKAMGQGQDAAWLEGDTMLMSAGSAIYTATFGKKGGPAAWRLVRDFSDAGIAVITRIAVANRSRIAFVATTTAP